MGAGFDINNHYDAFEAYEERLEFFSSRGLHELCSKTSKTMFYYYTDTLKKIDENKLQLIKNEKSIRFDKNAKSFLIQYRRTL